LFINVNYVIVYWYITDMTKGRGMKVISLLHIMSVEQVCFSFLFWLKLPLPASYIVIKEKSLSRGWDRSSEAKVKFGRLFTGEN
jgi:hypothetical protein